MNYYPVLKLKVGGAVTECCTGKSQKLKLCDDESIHNFQGAAANVSVREESPRNLGKTEHQDYRNINHEETRPFGEYPLGRGQRGACLPWVLGVGHGLKVPL